MPEETIYNSHLDTQLEARNEFKARMFRWQKPLVNSYRLETEFSTTKFLSFGPAKRGIVVYRVRRLPYEMHRLFHRC
jgi:hypothetical protein